MEHQYRCGTRTVTPRAACQSPCSLCPLKSKSQFVTPYSSLVTPGHPCWCAAEAACFTVRNSRPSHSMSTPGSVKAR